MATPWAGAGSGPAPTVTFRTARSDGTAYRRYERGPAHVHALHPPIRRPAARRPGPWVTQRGFSTHRFAFDTAVVFSCSLRHAVTPVTRGRRFVFLPFLYDETAADIRRHNVDRITGDASA